MKWRWWPRRAAPPRERTVAEWLGDEYAAGNLDAEEHQYQLDILELFLDEPASIVKYVAGMRR